MAERLKIKTVDDWYQVSNKVIHVNRGGGLLRYYDDSHIKMICELVPNDDWQHWRFHYAPRGFWTEKANRVKYLKWLEGQLGYAKPQDWYQVTHKRFLRFHGKVIVGSSSPPEIVRELYPRYNWLPWKFRNAELGFWDKKANQKRYLEWLGKQLGYKKREDWYQLTKRDFYRNHGRTLVDAHFDTVPLFCLQAHYPTYPWLPWLFSKTPEGFWNEKKNRIWYLKWLGKKKGFEKPNDWYNLGEKDLCKNKGSGLYAYYNCKIHIAVAEIYPKRTWHPWLFLQTPKGFFQNKKNRVKYYQWLIKKLRIRTRHRIDSIQLTEIASTSGASLVGKLPLGRIKTEMMACFVQANRE